MSSLEERLKKVEEKVQDISLNTGSKGPKDDLSKVIDEAMEYKMKEEKEEELERAKRKTSVIIHGVPESKSQQANESRRRQRQH